LIGFCYYDGKFGIVEGLFLCGDCCVGWVIEVVWCDGGCFDGWSEYFFYDCWMVFVEVAFVEELVDVVWYIICECEFSEVLLWDYFDLGFDKDWLWEDW